MIDRTKIGWKEVRGLTSEVRGPQSGLGSTSTGAGGPVISHVRSQISKGLRFFRLFAAISAYFRLFPPNSEKNIRKYRGNCGARYESSLNLTFKFRFSAVILFIVSESTA